MPALMSVSDAQAAVLGESLPLLTSAAQLASVAGLGLAEDVVSRVDSPPFDKSMMDGYAVRATDVQSAGTTLRVLGELTAGRAFEGRVGAGESLRIMTGAPIPPGADAIIRLEDTDGGTAQVRVNIGAVRPELNIIRKGQNLRTGEVVLSRGRRLRPADVAMLAELGCGMVSVHRRARAAVLATGDELVPPGEPLGPGQICTSNELLLLAQLRGWGCDAAGLGIARDTEDHLRERIAAGLDRDVMLLTGGVSMGSLDLVPKVLTDLGVRQVFHKVHMKPGKPMWFGIRDNPASARRTLIFALPGNPVSTMVCSELFVRPALAKLAGSEQPIPRRITARLSRDHRFRDERPTYFPAWLAVSGDGVTVTPTAWRGSSDVRSTVDANSLIAFAAGERMYAAGEAVEVIPFCDAVGTALNGLDA
jgi:molybdopterin molybdotransferase